MIRNSEQGLQRGMNTFRQKLELNREVRETGSSSWHRAELTQANSHVPFPAVFLWEQATVLCFDSNSSSYFVMSSTAVGISEATRSFSNSQEDLRKGKHVLICFQTDNIIKRLAWAQRIHQLLPTDGCWYWCNDGCWSQHQYVTCMKILGNAQK